MNRSTRIAQSLLILQMMLGSLLAAKERPETEIDRLYNKPLNELLEIETEAKANVGSRGKAIDLLKAKTPIDVVTAKQINLTGYTELSKVLQRFIPGFNYPRTTIADGTDHIRPFTLRGMSPDQVLVLVNGKRLHASSLLHVNGTIGRGSTGVDLNTIPLHSIERIEVLRGGASAQYGSDAIAGIINIILKSGSEEHRMTSTIGQSYEEDGELYQADIHYGFNLPLDGFINLTAEVRDRNPTNRDPVDTRQQYFDDDPRNNNPAKPNNRSGEPDTQDFLLTINSELPFSDAILFYLQSSFNYRQSEGGVFFRRPLDNRNVREIYPDGFLPLIKPDIFDYSSTVGTKGETKLNIKWDFSHTVGGNRIEYQVKDSLNASLGTLSPRSFDAGGLDFRQHTTNLDFVKKQNIGLDKPINIATGLEWRYETFEIFSGDEASHVDGGVPVLDGPNAGQNTITGAQGFPGFQAINELQEDRHNFSVYLDLDGEVFDNLSLGLAGRYEYYNDFGSSINGKFSLAFQAKDDLLLRSSISTGFRAPSLQQSFFNSISSINIDNEIISVSTLSVDSPLAKALGARSLEAEESQHFTAGFVYQPLDDFSFSADYFYTKINNRIIFSRNITYSISPDIANILSTENLSAARFFTNAIDTETYGFDLRTNYNINLESLGDIKLSALYHYNKTKIIGGVRSPEILGAEGGNIIFSDSDRNRLELGQPNESLILMANYKYGSFNSLFKMIKAGSFSEEGRRLNSQWFADIDLSYQIHENFNLGLGVHNLFNRENSGSENSNDGGLIQHNPYGHKGGFYYLRLSADF